MLLSFMLLKKPWEDQLIAAIATHQHYPELRFLPAALTPPKMPIATGDGPLCYGLSYQ